MQAPSTSRKGHRDQAGHQGVGQTDRQTETRTSWCVRHLQYLREGRLDAGSTWQRERDGSMQSGLLSQENIVLSQKSVVGGGGRVKGHEKVKWDRVSGCGHSGPKGFMVDRAGGAFQKRA